MVAPAFSSARAARAIAGKGGNPRKTRIDVFLS